MTGPQYGQQEPPHHELRSQTSARVKQWWKHRRVRLPPRIYSAAATLASERVRSSLDTRGIIASSCSSVTADQS